MLVQSFIAGPKFMGVKMLPPGAHLVSYNAAEKKGSDFAPTISFFLHIAPKQVQQATCLWHHRTSEIARSDAQHALSALATPKT